MVTGNQQKGKRTVETEVSRCEFHGHAYRILRRQTGSFAPTFAWESADGFEVGFATIADAEDAAVNAITERYAAPEA